MPARRKKNMYAGEHKSKALQKARHGSRVRYGRSGSESTDNKHIREGARYNADSRNIGSRDRMTGRFVKQKNRGNR